LFVIDVKLGLLSGSHVRIFETCALLQISLGRKNQERRN